MERERQVKGERKEEVVERERKGEEVVDRDKKEGEMQQYR